MKKKQFTIFVLTSGQNNSGVNQYFENMSSRFSEHNFQKKVQNGKKALSTIAIALAVGAVIIIGAVLIILIL